MGAYACVIVSSQHVELVCNSLPTWDHRSRVIKVDLAEADEICRFFVDRVDGKRVAGRKVAAPLVEKKGLESYECQNGSRTLGGGISRLFNLLYPLNLTTYALRDTHTSWKVLEASGHDNIWVRRDLDYSDTPSLRSPGDGTEIEADSYCIFEDTRKCAR